MDPIEIERALTVCAEAFVQTHYPDIELRYEPLLRKLKLQELAPREEAADILHSVAGMIEPKSPEAAACLVRHA